MNRATARSSPCSLKIVTSKSKIDPLERNAAAEHTLVSLAASGKGPPEVYNDLAEDAFGRGQLDQAREYWERAYEVEPWNAPDRLEPRHAVLLNNLAWLISSTPPIELDRALVLANQALAMKPGDPAFRGTRGEVLAKLGREKEAIPDLKAALDAKPVPPSPTIQKLLDKLEAKLGEGGTGTGTGTVPKPPTETNAPPSS